MPIIFSVIIPTLNQSCKLDLCLSNLAKLDFNPDNFEVLVIDNASTDDTKDIANKYIGKIKNIQYHYCANSGLMAARHMGCDKANGEILSYLDDDSLVIKEWLQGMMESFDHNNVVIAGGPCIPKYESPPPKWIDYFWSNNEYGKANTFLSLMDFGGIFTMIPPVWIFGCNYSIRKSTFLNYGGTQPDYYPEKYRAYQGMGESGLSLKLQQNGILAAYNPLARINHLITSSRLTVDYFCWRSFFNGIGSSYYDIRKQYFTDGLREASSNSSPISNSVIMFIQQPLRNIKLYIKRYFSLPNFYSTDILQEPSEILALKKRVDESYQAGYAFHRESLIKDPNLIEWVLRTNYFGDNGNLPI